MNTDEAESRNFFMYVIKIFKILAAIACIGFFIFLAVKYTVDFLLLALLIFAIVVGIVLFWRIFIWLLGAVALIAIIFCGIAILGYFGSIFQ